MRIVSVNVGGVSELEWRGRVVRTAFVKSPVAGEVDVEREGLVGDTQADRSVHGGPDKAVYLYPGEHYGHWEETLGRDLDPGALGENLTTEGLVESEIHVGDRLEAGAALLEVSQPRLPCFKLAARHGRADLPRLFTRAALPGFYLRVIRPGRVRAGDPIRVVGRHPEALTVRRVFLLQTGVVPDPALERRLAALPVLGRGARETFRDRTGLQADVREARPGDLAGLADLLQTADLPVDGFPRDTPVVLVAETGGALVGGVAMERWGDAALLRSLVVAEAHRGSGLGSAMVAAVVARARAGRAGSVSLLTETAEDYFRDLGFRTVARSELPPSLGRSAELRGVCPDTAVAMTRPLRDETGTADGEPPVSDPPA